MINYFFFLHLAQKILNSKLADPHAKVHICPRGDWLSMWGMLETGMPQNHCTPNAALASPGARCVSGLCLQTLLPSNSAPAAGALLAVKAGKILWAAFRPDLNRSPCISWLSLPWSWICIPVNNLLSTGQSSKGLSGSLVAHSLPPISVGLAAFC